MANAKKKSFVVYVDLDDQTRHFTDEQEGKLFRRMMRHQKGVPYESGDSMVELAFNFVKVGMEHNDARYRETCRQRAEAGRKGGKTRAANARRQAQANEANQADTETDTETEPDTEPVTETVTEPVTETAPETETVPEARPAGSGVGPDEQASLSLLRECEIMIPSCQQEEVFRWVKQVGLEELRQAAWTARSRGKGTWAYVKGVLVNRQQEKPRYACQTRLKEPIPLRPDPVEQERRMLEKRREMEGLRRMLRQQEQDESENAVRDEGRADPEPLGWQTPPERGRLA